jgi:hypothetical protein
MSELNQVTENIRDTLIRNFKNTEMGLVRIAKNLNLSDMNDAEIIEYCRKIIRSTPVENIEVRGKNYYLHCQVYSAVLTINRSSLGIITAKKLQA